MTDINRVWASGGSKNEPDPGEVESGHGTTNPPHNDWENWWKNRVDTLLKAIIESQVVPWDSAITYNRPVSVEESGVWYELQNATSLNEQPSTNPSVWTALGSGVKVTQAAVSGLTAALALKAPLASPSLTGNPTAPTQTAGNNSTRLATTAFVTAAINALSAVYAAISHGHAITDVTGLQGALDGKAASSHNHTVSNISDIDTGYSIDLAGSSGYIKLPNWLGGLIIQFGSTSSIPDGGNAGVTLPITYPNAHFGAVATGNSTSDPIVMQTYGTLGLSSFTIHHWGASVSAQAFWISVGY